MRHSALGYMVTAEGINSCLTCHIGKVSFMTCEYDWNSTQNIMIYVKNKDELVLR